MSRRAISRCHRPFYAVLAGRADDAVARYRGCSSGARGSGGAQQRIARGLRAIRACRACGAAISSSISLRLGACCATVRASGATRRRRRAHNAVLAERTRKARGGGNTVGQRVVRASRAVDLQPIRAVLACAARQATCQLHRPCCAVFPRRTLGVRGRRFRAVRACWACGASVVCGGYGTEEGARRAVGGNGHSCSGAAGARMALQASSYGCGRCRP